MSEANNSNEEIKYEKDGFPMARIRSIIKSSADAEVTNLSAKAVYLVSKSAELFIQHISREGYARSNKRLLEYKDLANYVQSDDRLEFLHQIVPKKITFGQYKEILAKEANKQAGGSEDDSTSESNASSENEEDDDDDDSSEDDDSNSNEEDENESNEESDNKSESSNVKEMETKKINGNTKKGTKK